MKTQTITIYCHEKDCLEYKKIKWNGEFLGKWFCKHHAWKHLENLNGKKKKKFIEEEHKQILEGKI